ncbi:MAG: hypothetical protein KIS73_27750 [Enhydrobacter sp.]|nr:hypothetical protein [Enhydrobacter sp.]
MMEKASIMVGKCYRDDDGVVYRVTSHDPRTVQFVAHGRLDAGAASGQQGTEPWETFLEKVQGEVACP